ncbi:hypothetical protein TNCV_4598841 [Trichonephila clavipes]|nr:hypothetical protein TNCV_4598841 [Trichonephila clavipes]
MDEPEMSRWKSIGLKWWTGGGTDTVAELCRDVASYSEVGEKRISLSAPAGDEQVSGQQGSLRGRVCGGRVACVVGDGSKERSAESGPRGRGTWLRIARRRGLLHIEKFSLDRARQHVMGVSPVSSFEESSGGYTGHVRKLWQFVAWRGPRWN